MSREYTVCLFSHNWNLLKEDAASCEHLDGGFFYGSHQE
jgi:hypothetical protein